MKMSILAASAQDRFLRRTFRFFLIAALLVVTAQRLPAPIQEVPESPTPAPEQSAKPKAKRTVKAKASENSESSTKSPTPSPTPKTQALGPSLFAGTWIGTLEQGAFGNVEYTLFINVSGTVVTQKSSKFGSHTYNATNDGKMMKWRSGPFRQSANTLTPSPDGKTASVSASDSILGNHSAVFRRMSR